MIQNLPLLVVTSIGSLDWSIIIFYLLVVVGIGVAAGFVRKKGGEGGHYFLADNSLKWPIIGLAMFAANISTVHLVSLAQCALISNFKSQILEPLPCESSATPIRTMPSISLGNFPTVLPEKSSATSTARSRSPIAPPKSPSCWRVIRLPERLLLPRNLFSWISLRP
jgi:hypothetical protein